MGTVHDTGTFLTVLSPRGQQLEQGWCADASLEPVPQDIFMMLLGLGQQCAEINAKLLTAGKELFLSPGINKYPFCMGWISDIY